MNLKDKIGLWADDRLGKLYFERVPLQRVKEWALSLLIPKCCAFDDGTGEPCKQHGEPCLLPNWNAEEEEIEWVCYEHMHSKGFCRGCHLFWAGCEDFDFDPHGLCSNCRHDPDITGNDEDYEPEGWEEAMFNEGLP
jgi:hypothetical protein